MLTETRQGGAPSTPNRYAYGSFMPLMMPRM